MSLGQRPHAFRRLLVLELFFTAMLVGCATLPLSPQTAGKKLIEFGWDEPDTAFMRQHIAEMEASPFDGCVFHVNYTSSNGTPGPFMWEAWSHRAFTDVELQAALADLRAIHFSRFLHNFLRFNTVPGNVDWFDDFGAIRNNARLAARLARDGKAAGILFDVEQYEAPLFDYRRQRDAATKSWKEYAAQARRRGREVMEAFQDGYPDLIVFLTFGYSVPWLETDHGTKPLAAADYGLLVSFLDGMLDAATGRTRLVEGYEPAYYHNKDRGSFGAARRMITNELLPIVADPEKYRRMVSVSFGLWMDFDSTAIGWDARDAGQNFYTPDEFGASIQAALEAADEFVWVYTQVPRWWSAEGKPANLPDGYAEAIRRARHGLTPH